MKTVKSGQHRLFEREEAVSRAVSEMLRAIEQQGMDAVRRYSEQFDGWSPASFDPVKRSFANRLSASRPSGEAGSANPGSVLKTS